MGKGVYIPGGGDGMQGLKTGQSSDDYYCPLDTKGSSIKTGDIDRTRITGGLGHATVTSLNNDAPKSAYSNRSKSQDDDLPHRLIQNYHAHEHVHGSGLAGRFNAWLAVGITRRVGTMWAAYAFALIALVSLPAAISSGDTLIIIAWIAQTFLQLVLLPIIIVGQNVISTAQDQRAETDHETLVLLRDLNTTQLEILRRLDHV